VVPVNLLPSESARRAGRAGRVVVVPVAHRSAEVTLGGLFIFSEDSETHQRPALGVAVWWHW